MGDIVDIRKPYIKPAVIFEKTIETLAAYCDSQWTGPAVQCMTDLCDMPNS